MLITFQWNVKLTVYAIFFSLFPSLFAVSARGSVVPVRCSYNCNFARNFDSIFYNSNVNMKIFKDIITGDEMFSDTYKLQLVDEVIYEVYGKLVSRGSEEIKIEGFNPSAEEADEGTDSHTESGVDVVLNHRLQECFAFGDKKSFTLYLKEYMKKILAKLEESAPDQVPVFKNNMNKQMKEILGRFKELQFFTGESMDPDGMIALCEYREVNGAQVPVFMFFKHGLEEEKC